MNTRKQLRVYEDSYETFGEADFIQASEPTQISTEEKIKILLHEYATLRQEVISRTSHGFQLMSVGAVMVAWIIATQSYSPYFWLGVGFALSIFIVAIWFTMRDLYKAVQRIQEIEQHINQRAGEELLVWESKWGGAVTGFWGTARPIHKR